MRITVSIREEFAREVKEIAWNREQSVSSLVSDAVEKYLGELNRREAWKKLLELAGKAHMAPDALEELEKGRRDGEQLLMKF